MTTKTWQVGIFEILQKLLDIFEIFWKYSGSFEIILNSSGQFWNYGIIVGSFDIDLFSYIYTVYFSFLHLEVCFSQMFKRYITSF